MYVQYYSVDKLKEDYDGGVTGYSDPKVCETAPRKFCDLHEPLTATSEHLCKTHCNLY